jgi:predicted acyltransferase (DUF342 family)
VSSFAAASILLLALVIWTGVPFAPALLELYRRTDVAPLSVPRAHGNQTDHFALRFRDYIRAQLEAMGPLPPKTERAFLPDGTPLYVVNEERPFTSELPERRNPAPPPRVLCVNIPLEIPDGTTAFREIFAQCRLATGSACVFRGVFGEEDIRLGDRCVILRWVHSEKSLSVGNDGQLYGRASANEQIELHAGTRFERVTAPVILFSVAGGDRAVEAAFQNQILPEAALTGDHGMRLIRGDHVIPAEDFSDGDIVVSGRLIVGERANVRGCLNAAEGVSVGRGARVKGAIVSRGSIWLAEGAESSGPLISEQEVYVERSCRIGSLAAPTTITAPCIYVEPGAISYGTIWPRGFGLVTSFV